MKIKLLTVFLGISTMVLGITVWYFNMQLKNYEKTVADRELTIINYQKVTRSIGRSGGIFSERLKGI